MDIYGYIRLYADIYYYMYMSFWKVVLFLTSGSVIVALYLPLLELSAPTAPIVDYFFELWTSLDEFGRVWTKCRNIELDFL